MFGLLKVYHPIFKAISKLHLVRSILKLVDPSLLACFFVSVTLPCSDFNEASNLSLRGSAFAVSVIVSKIGQPMSAQLVLIVEVINPGLQIKYGFRS